jgi:hypothetical protein
LEEVFALGVMAVGEGEGFMAVRERRVEGVSGREVRERKRTWSSLRSTIQDQACPTSSSHL